MSNRLAQPPAKVFLKGSLGSLQIANTNFVPFSWLILPYHDIFKSFKQTIHNYIYEKCEIASRFENSIQIYFYPEII